MEMIRRREERGDEARQDRECLWEDENGEWGRKRSMNLSNEPMAPEHWTIEKKQRAWDIELRNFREKQRKRLTYIRIKSKRKVAELHERIYFTVRWANPKLPNAYQKIVFDYCDHLIGPMPDTPYHKWSLLVVWQTRLESGPEAKASLEVQGLLERLSKLVLRRDEALVNVMVKLEEDTHRMTIAKEGEVRWHMETGMKCARDDYWTIWYLARRGQTEELSRYLKTNSDVDVRDPDFGYTALHYACKCNQYATFAVLLAAGANERAVIAEDGRTPLHLAAAYGSRQMVLELLAVGACYEATDNFGATALDMARQNKNEPVVKTLENWVHLVPKQEETPRPELDDDQVPEEYLSTPYEVLLQMSPALRVVTSRLEGPIDSSRPVSSGESGRDIGAELRLCEKRAAMCEVEGFHSQSVKTIRRRWTAAKKAYQRQQQLQQQEQRYPLEGENEGKSCVSMKGVDQSSAHHLHRTHCPTLQNGDCQSVGENSELTAPDISASTIPLSVPAPPSSSTTKAVTIISPAFLLSVCLQLAEVFLADHEHEAAELVLSDGLTLLGVGDLDGMARMSLLKRYCQLLLFLSDKHGASAANSHARSDRRVNPKSTPHRQNSMMTSTFKTLYGEIDQSTAGEAGDNSGLGDLEVSMSEEEASHFIALTTHRRPSQHSHSQLYEAKQGGDDDDSLKDDSRWHSSLLEASSYADGDEAHPTTSHVTFAATAPAGSDAESMGPLSATTGVHRSATLPLPLQQPDDFTTDWPAQTEDDGLAEGTGSVMEMVELIRTLVPSAVVPSATAAGQRRSMSSCYETLQPYQQYLVRVDNCLQEAIGLVRSQCERDFVESSLLGQLLHMAAESFDRQGRYDEALHYMAHAAVVFERTLGQADPETVSCLIELLRLTIRKNLVVANINKAVRDRQRELEIAQMNKYARAKLLEQGIKEEGIHASDKLNFKMVGYQATEVSRRLDRLTLKNPDSALRLSSKCYKLVALTDLIVAGEVDPTKVLSVDSSGDSSGAMGSSVIGDGDARARGLGGGSWSHVRMHRSQVPPVAKLHIDALDTSKFSESKL